MTFVYGIYIDIQSYVPSFVISWNDWDGNKTTKMDKTEPTNTAPDNLYEGEAEEKREVEEVEEENENKIGRASRWIFFVYFVRKRMQ